MHFITRTGAISYLGLRRRCPQRVDEAERAFHRANGLVLRNPRVANLLDCPSISLPIASSGLPVGLMLIGRRGADRELLEIASAIEAVPVR